MPRQHPNGLDIRPAEAAEAPLVHCLILELAEYEKLTHEAVVTVDDVRRTLFGERPYAEVLIARWRGEPVGFALFFHNYSTFLGKPGIYLEDVYVRQEHRGRGIGKALLVRLAVIARERDCGRIDWMVLGWNQSSIDFYHRLGAVPMDEWRHFRLSGDELAALAAQAPADSVSE